MADPLRLHPAELGPARLLKISTPVGHYMTLAWQRRLFEVPAPEAHNG